MTITWKQFRDSVETQMEQSGIDENTEIEYIDFSWADEVVLNKHEYRDGEMMIIS